MGHVDHGKTSILDSIRKTRVAEKETGGITQHIGAYQIEKEGKKITFIDTPGHEAFSAMRFRGAKIADIAILVVDATRGVQSQTKEAISQAKLAGIPIIAVLNKIDITLADPEKTKRELAKENVLVESLGGKIPSIEVSAKTGKGIEELLDLITLVAEVEEPKGDVSRPAEGAVIESYLDSQKGPTATLILNEGILKKGQILGTTSTCGKVKSLEDFQGKPVNEALPSDPVIVFGLENVPRVGENFKVFPDFETAKSEIRALSEKSTTSVLAVGPEQRVLNLILKTDVLGSTEAIEEVLKGLPKERIILRILKSGVGQINESDVKLAEIGKAIILGFRVKADAVARGLVEREKVRIIQFDIIYDLVEGVRKLIESRIKTEEVRVDLGKVKILAIFLDEKNRQIIGGKVIEGEIKKGVPIEVLRNEEVAGRGRLINLQRDKKDAEKVIKGQECGMLFEGDVKVQEGDILLFFEKRRAEIQ
jgi:translation initiation factor IF-2